MTVNPLFNGLLITWFVLASATFLILLFVNAPYGRHSRRGWGPRIADRAGWILMEAPAAAVFGILFLLGEHNSTLTALFFLLIWEAHYIHRAYIYPLSRRSEDSKMALVVAVTALFFNSANAYFNGRYLFDLSGGYPNSWLVGPRFLAGAGLFVTGFSINRQSDAILRNLRQPGKEGYKIPRGGLFRWVSCPNYLGEIVEWWGWALATWSLPGVAFAFWTCANLVPRARAHHRWYRQHFPDYPSDRKTLVPGIW